eukprot:243620-Prymnesium_polylepis.1
MGHCQAVSPTHGGPLRVRAEVGMALMHQQPLHTGCLTAYTLKALRQGRVGGVEQPALKAVTAACVCVTSARPCTPL